MLSRIISGLIMAGGIIAVLILCDAWVMHLVVAVVGTIAALEYHAMSNPNGSIFSRLIFTASAMSVALQPLINLAIDWPVRTAFATAFFLIAITHLFRPKPLGGASDRLARDALGIVYLGTTLPFILELRGLPANTALISESVGGWLLLMVIVITALSDTGGYFFGRAFGKHKLFEAVSPKKTIEGALGGLGCAIAGCFVMKSQIDALSGLSAMDCVALGILGTIASIIGDLVESLLKRGYDVKDSGTLIPGHGGVLDRVDALLFSAPAIFFYWGSCIA